MIYKSIYILIGLIASRYIIKNKNRNENNQRHTVVWQRVLGQQAGHEKLDALAPI